MPNRTLVKREEYIKDDINTDNDSFDNYILNVGGGLDSSISPVEINVLVYVSDIEKDSRVYVFEVHKDDDSGKDEGQGYFLGNVKGKIFSKEGVTVKTVHSGATGTVCVNWSGILSNVNAKADESASIESQTDFQITTTL